MRQRPRVFPGPLCPAYYASISSASRAARVGHAKSPQRWISPAAWRLQSASLTCCGLSSMSLDLGDRPRQPVYEQRPKDRLLGMPVPLGVAGILVLVHGKALPFRVQGPGGGYRLPSGPLSLFRAAQAKPAPGHEKQAQRRLYREDPCVTLNTLTSSSSERSAAHVFGRPFVPRRTPPARFGRWAKPSSSICSPRSCPHLGVEGQGAGVTSSRTFIVSALAH